LAENALLGEKLHNLLEKRQSAAAKCQHECSLSLIPTAKCRSASATHAKQINGTRADKVFGDNKTLGGGQLS